MQRSATPRICLVVNPLAGVGGQLALKGSDGEAGLRALKLGARPVAPARTARFLAAARRNGVLSNVLFLTAGGVMGAKELASAGARFDVVYDPPAWPTTRMDTLETVRRCVDREAELVVFVGGDGTARDVAEALRDAGAPEKPVLGVPSGVKVYSSVFAESPEAAAYALMEWLETRSTCSAEVVDIDEELFRRGVLSIKLYAELKTACSSYMVGSSKQPTRLGSDEAENLKAIARHFVERYYRNCTLYVMGPGQTVRAIAEELGVEKTLLGVDVVHSGRVLLRDAKENELYRAVLEHLKRGGSVYVVVTPIGGQGYILGRGNQQISPRILRLVGRDRIVVAATRSKLKRLKKLRIDTDDPELNAELRGYFRVIVDYGEEVLVKAE